MSAPRSSAGRSAPHLGLPSPAIGHPRPVRPFPPASPPGPEHLRLSCRRPVARHCDCGESRAPADALATHPAAPIPCASSMPLESEPDCSPLAPRQALALRQGVCATTAVQQAAGRHRDSSFYRARLAHPAGKGPQPSARPAPTHPSMLLVERCCRPRAPNPAQSHPHPDACRACCAQGSDLHAGDPNPAEAQGRALPACCAKGCPASRQAVHPTPRARSRDALPPRLPWRWPRGDPPGTGTSPREGGVPAMRRHGAGRPAHHPPAAQRLRSSSEDFASPRRPAIPHHAGARRRASPGRESPGLPAAPRTPAQRPG